MTASFVLLSIIPYPSGDCILAISGSGETNTIVSAAKISKNRGAKVLALTRKDLADLMEEKDFDKAEDLHDEMYMVLESHGLKPQKAFQAISK